MKWALQEKAALSCSFTPKHWDYLESNGNICMIDIPCLIWRVIVHEAGRVDGFQLRVRVV